MKNTFKAAALIAAVMLTVGCGEVNEPVYVVQSSSTVTSEASSEAIVTTPAEPESSEESSSDSGEEELVPPEITSQEMSKKLAVSGVTVGEFYCRYPEIGGIDAISNYYKKQCDDSLAFAQMSAEYADLEAVRNNEQEQMKFSYDSKAVFNKNGYISVKTVCDEPDTLNGGTSEYVTAQTFSVRTGSALTLADVLKGTAHEQSDAISQTFVTMINEEPDYYYENAAQIAMMGETVSSVMISVTDNGVEFIMLPETLAPVNDVTLAKWNCAQPSFSLGFDSPLLKDEIKKCAE